MQETHITLAHGNGGYFMRTLIKQVFAKQLANPELDIQADAIALNLNDRNIMFTTDGFAVQPLEFPGGDIGSLAVHGTTNDLAVSGAIPQYLSLNAFIEEGLEISQLTRIIHSLGQAASAIDVQVVAGDTKVLPRGQGGGLYLATTGIGIRNNNTPLGLNQIQAGDKILVSGPVGDHGICVLLAREQFGLQGSLRSDSASILPLTQALLEYSGLRFMRDPTRGGLATVAHEINQATGLTVRLQQPDIPLHEEVQSVCDILGYDPLYLACEGRVVAIVASEQADAALACWQALADGQQAAIIGQVESGTHAVIMETELGGLRSLEELEDDPLPRIC